MKILFLEGDMSRRGGTERMTALLSGYLCPRHKVQIISLHMAGENVFFPLDKRVKHSCLGVSGMSRQIKAIRRVLRRKKTDVVINVDTGMGIYGIFAAAGLKTKVITWEHSNFFNNWNSRSFPVLRKIAAKHSDAMVVLTERDKENYETGIRGCVPVTAISNPVEEHSVPYDIHSKIILSVGNFSRVKRFELIPEIGKKLFSVCPEWKWVICGDGEGREGVLEKIREYGLEEKILSVGAVQDMEPEYRRAAMTVMTSSMEGLPMVLLEAKSYGLPLVSFDIMTGPSDIIRDGVNGYLIEDNNTEQMTEKILALMQEDALRKKFSENAELDMERFSSETIVYRWEKLIEQLGT